MARLRQLQPYHGTLWIAVLLLIAGCATITGGSEEVIRFESTPPGATVTAGGVEYTTPTSVPLSRGEEQVITIEKEGYKKVTVSLTRSFRGWATIGGNILWLLPGVVVDGMTGSWYEFDEKTVRVTLEPRFTTPGTQMPAAAPVLQPGAQTTYGVHFASYENVELAQQGWSEIWSKYSQLLTSVQPYIDLGSSAGGQPQYQLYGRGLTKAQAEGLCRNLQQRNEPCAVVSF